MNKNFNEKQIKEEITRLKSVVEDIELERRMVFLETGRHKSSKDIIERVTECDEEIKECKAQIMEFKKKLP